MFNTDPEKYLKIKRKIKRKQVKITAAVKDTFKYIYIGGCLTLGYLGVISLIWVLQTNL